MKTLDNIKTILGNRQVSISREISKKFEEVYRGTIEDVIKELTEIKGELVIVVDGNHEEKTYDNLTIIEHVNLYIKEGYKTMDAIKLVAKERNVNKNEVYNEYNRGEEK